MPPTAKDENAPQTVPIKCLGLVAALMLSAVLYNGLGGGWKNSVRGARGAVHEAAVPLQKRVRPSKYANDPEIPDQVVVTKSGGPVAVSSLPSATIPTRLLPPPPKMLPFAAKVDAEAAGHYQEMARDRLSCHAREGHDIAGDDAFVWGLAFNVASAAECCAACAAQRKVCGEKESRGKQFWRASRREKTQARCNGHTGACNAWVFCPGSPDAAGYEDRCFSYAACQPACTAKLGIDPMLCVRCYHRSYTIHNHSKGECWLKHEPNVSYPTSPGAFNRRSLVCNPPKKC